MSPHFIVTRQPDSRMHILTRQYETLILKERRFLVNVAQKSQYMKGNREGTEAADQRMNRPGGFFCLSLFFWLIHLRGDILPHEEGLWPEWRVAELNGPGHKCFWERGRSYRKRQRWDNNNERGQMWCDWVEGWKGDKADLQSLL